MKKSLSENSILILATFSKEGPSKCSGLDVCQYDKDSLAPILDGVNLIETFKEICTRPFDTTQSFTYSVSKKK